MGDQDNSTALSSSYKWKLPNEIHHQDTKTPKPQSSLCLGVLVVKISAAAAAAEEGAENAAHDLAAELGAHRTRHAGADTDRDLSQIGLAAALRRCRRGRRGGRAFVQTLVRRFAIDRLLVMPKQRRAPHDRLALGIGERRQLG